MSKNKRNFYFNEITRERQIEFLEKMADKEPACISNDGPGYCISVNGTGQKEFCQSADTAIMLLTTSYRDVNVWVKRVFTPNQLRRN